MPDGPLRVKQRRTQNEQIRFAVPEIADIKGPDRVLSRWAKTRSWLTASFALAAPAGKSNVA